MKFLILICFVFCANIYCMAQPDNINFTPEAGLCYARCFTPQKYTTNEYKYFVLKKGQIATGLQVKKTKVPFDAVNSMAFITHNLHESEGHWDTLSINNKEIELDIVEDTLHHSHQLSLVKIVVSTSIPGTHQSDWHEVVCPNKISKKFIEKLQLALKQKGYYKGEMYNEMNNEIKAALIQYQKNNSLPIGSLDLQTMRKLGVID